VESYSPYPNTRLHLEPQFRPSLAHVQARGPDRTSAPETLFAAGCRLRGLCQDGSGESKKKGTMAKLTSTIIEAAIAGFEAQKKSIDTQIAELRGMLTTKPESAEETPTKTTRRKFSAAVRKRMREAQRLRWAKIRGESALVKKAAKTVKPKGGMTAAGRKALSLAMKKRWAAKKAAQKQ
jgi:hypothetical protein